MGSLLSAIKFLTLFPFGPDYDPRLGKSLSFFPLVGALIGVAAAALNYLLLIVLPAAVTNLLLIALLIILRGGLHLDGLMDTADGLFSQKDRPGMLEVMRDSRVGTFGAIALVSTLLIKWSVLNQLVGLKWRALILAPAMGEWAIVYSALRYPYARSGQGKGRIFAEQAGWLQFAVASLTALGLSAVVLERSLWLLLLFVPFIIVTAAYLARRLGGFTGDAYGAIAEVGEIMGFLLILAVLGG